MSKFTSKLSMLILIISVFLLTACSSGAVTSSPSPTINSPIYTTTLASPTLSSASPTVSSASTTASLSTKPSPTATKPISTNNKQLSGYVIGIDAGHQLKGNSSLEKSGPNSSVMKAKVTTGATGNNSGIREQVINLQVAKKLKTKLESLGAKVVMTRTTENVDISNKERAELFNKAHVDFAIRIHCDSSDNRSVNGLSILIPDSKNNASIYNKSKRLADSLIGPMCKSTGAANRGVIQRSDQTGFNWSSVPIVTVEMGFLSNANEESKLITSSYQDKLVSGYAQGILQYVKN